jgi:hypothetical protein
VFGRNRRREDRPSLANGLTLRQWDELYGQAAFERTRRKVRLAAVVFGVLFLVPLTAILATNGTALAHSTRTFIAFAAYITLIGLVLSSGLLIGWRLIERYGDRPSLASASPTHRGKYKRRK